MNDSYDNAQTDKEAVARHGEGLTHALTGGSMTGGWRHHIFSTPAPCICCGAPTTDGVRVAGRPVVASRPSLRAHRSCWTDARRKTREMVR